MRFSWTPELTATFTELWEQHKSLGEIAKALGTTYHSVEAKRRRLKLATHAPPNRLQPKVYKKHPAPATASWPPPREKPTCKWPIGHPHEKGFHFCGVQTNGKPYCPAHHEMAYQRPVKSRHPIAKMKVPA